MKRRRAVRINKGQKAATAKVAAGLRKAFGEDVAVSASFLKPIERIPIGIPAIDWVIGGGIPIGKIIEIFGDWSTCKSLLCHHIIAAFQRVGGVAILNDSEEAYHPEFASRMGVNNDLLIYTDPWTVEEMFDYNIEALELLDGKRPAVEVWDSLAATSTAHLEGTDTGTRDMTRAFFVGQGMQKIRSKLGKARASFVLVNQTREKIGVLYGSKITTPGGKAIKFHSSVRILLTVGKDIIEGDKKGGEVIGKEGVVKVVKNRTARPLRSVPFEVYFDTGFEKWTGVLEALKAAGMVEPRGGWWQLIDADRDTGEVEEVGKKFRAADVEEVLSDELVARLLERAGE